MPATLYNLNATYAARGIANAETGIVVQSVKQTFTPVNDTLADHTGRVTGLARLIDLTHKVDVSGAINNNTGFASNNVSFVADVACANQLDWHGFTASHPLFVEDISYDESISTWKTVNISLIRYLGINA